MYPGEDGTCLYEPIKKLVTAGLQAGLNIDTMIEMQWRDEHYRPGDVHRIVPCRELVMD